MATRINIKGIASYPHLDQPRVPGRPGHQQGDPKYSVVVILDDDNDWQAIKGALEAEQKAGFPNGWPNNARWPLKQYTEQDAPKPELVGKHYVNCSSADPVPAFNAEVMPIKPTPDVIYPGCRVIAATAVAAYNNAGQGISFFLNAIQKIGDGPRLDDRPNPATLFQPTETQNVAGYNPGAFPMGTPQNPGPQGQAAPQPQPGVGGNSGMSPGSMPPGTMPWDE